MLIFQIFSISTRSASFCTGPYFAEFVQIVDRICENSWKLRFSRFSGHAKAKEALVAVVKLQFRTPPKAARLCILMTTFSWKTNEMMTMARWNLCRRRNASRTNELEEGSQASPHSWCFQIQMTCLLDEKTGRHREHEDRTPYTKSVHLVPKTVPKTVHLKTKSVHFALYRHRCLPARLINRTKVEKNAIE